MKERIFRVSTGNIFEDAADFASDAVDAAGDVVSSAWDVVDDIPGFKQLGDGTKALFTGPLRDFANSTVGQVVIRALSSSLMAASYGLSSFPLLGPQLALSGHALAMAMPGMVKGESFWKAYFNEGLWRVEQTAKILGTDAANKLVDQAKQELEGALKQVQTVLSKSFKGLDGMVVTAALSTGNPLSKYMTPEALAGQLGIPSLSVEELAKRFGIQDINAAILQHYLYPEKWPYFPSVNSYDPVTGKAKPGIKLVTRPVSTTTKSTKTPCENYETAVKMKLPQATINVLKKQCEDYKKTQLPKATFSSSALKALANLGTIKKPDVTASLAELQTLAPPEETSTTKKWLIIGAAVLGLGGVGGFILWRRKR